MALTGAFAIRPRATQPPWRGAASLYGAQRGCRAIARAAPPRRVRRLYPAWLAGIDEGLDLGCAASSAAPSMHGAPGQLGAIDAPRRGATPRAQAGLLRPARRRLSLASLPSENGPEEAHVSACIPPLSIVNSPVFLAFRLIPCLDKSHVSDWRNRMSGTSSFTQKCRFAHFKRSITDLQVCCIEHCSPYRGLPV